MNLFFLLRESTRLDTKNQRPSVCGGGGVGGCVGVLTKFSELLWPKASPLDLCFVFVPGPSFSIRNKNSYN